MEILRSSYLHSGISYTVKTPSLYWISPQIPTSHARPLRYIYIHICVCVIYMRWICEASRYVKSQDSDHLALSLINITASAIRCRKAFPCVFYALADLWLAVNVKSWFYKSWSSKLKRYPFALDIYEYFTTIYTALMLQNLLKCSWNHRDAISLIYKCNSVLVCLYFFFNTNQTFNCQICLGIRRSPQWDSSNDETKSSYWITALGSLLVPRHTSRCYSVFTPLIFFHLNIDVH